MSNKKFPEPPDPPLFPDNPKLKNLHKKRECNKKTISAMQ